MHFGPSNRADRKTTEREGSTMCGGPLCTKTFSTERGGQKKKKGHGFGVSEYEEVLEPFTIVNFFLFLYNATRQRFFFFVRDSAFPKACVLCSWEGWPNTHGTQHQTASFPTRERFRGSHRALATYAKTLATTVHFFFF